VGQFENRLLELERGTEPFGNRLGRASGFPFRSTVFEHLANAPEQTLATDAVKALACFLHEPDTNNLSQKEIRSELSAAGVSMDAVKKRYETLLAQAAGRAVLAGAKAQRRSFMARMLELRKQLPQGGDVRKQIREFVKDVFGERAEAAVAWRNFEHASDDDLRTMVEDLTLLDELEKDDSSSSPPA
jgi:hypothetical protein